MGLQDVIRFFLPKEEHFYDFLENHAKVAHDGAQALASFTTHERSGAEARGAVETCEHEGDSIVHAMEEALAKTFVTPIDREDLHRLTSELDLVLDLTNGAIFALTKLGLAAPTEPMKRLARILVDCTHRINVAVPKLRRHQYAEIVVVSRELRKLERDADAIYSDAVAALFADAKVEAKQLICEKTVLDDLENAIDQSDLVGDILANLAVKNG